MHRTLLVLFGLVLALAPIPLGSNRDWAWSPLAAAAGLLLFGAAIALALNPDGSRRVVAHFNALLVPGVLTALALAWVTVQISTWTPESWASSLSAATVFGPVAVTRSIAFEHELLFTGLMRLLTNVSFFLLGALLATRASDARGLLGTIVVSASAYTLYAMVAQAANRAASWTGLSVWTPFEPYFTGTFINANNYATYTGVAAITALTLGLRPHRALGAETTRQRWRRRLSQFSGMGGFWLAAALVLMAGVLFSASRAGWASFILASMAMTVLYTRGYARLGWLVLAPVTVVVLTLVLPGGATLVGRFVTLLNQGEGGRAALFPATIDAIALKPLIGWGLNSFQASIGIIQPAALIGYYDKAHNTYLELAFDLGIPAAAALVAAVVWIVGRCLAGFFQRNRDAELAGVGFLVAVLAGFHALFDFGLQIPAMACTFFAILGIAWAQSWSGRPTRNPLRHPDGEVPGSVLREGGSARATGS